MAPQNDDATADACAALGVPLPAGASSDASPPSALLPQLFPPESPTGPQWRPLFLLPIPGLDTLISTLKPPLDVLKALLTVVAALIDTLSAILIGLLDPFRAIVLAVYQLLKDLLTDLVNAGAYMYFDAPGITSPEATLAEMGFPTEPAKTFKHGRTGGPPPLPPVDAYAKWAERFAQSFDDPGDDRRPILSDGASVTAVFIVGAAPSLDALRQLLYLIGKLFNIQPFIDAWERYRAGTPDPDLTRAWIDPVAPDWESVKLKDLFPPIEKLLEIPEALRGLLLAVDGIVALLKDLAQALKDKVQTLTDMVTAIQAVLDLLEALKAAGLHILPVATDKGIEGLKTAFNAATNRPPGGYIGGVCLLAAGPGLADAAVLWNLLGQGGAMDMLKKAVDDTAANAAEAAEKAQLGQKIDDLGAAAVKAGHDLVEAAENAPGQLADDLTSPVDEAVRAARESVAAAVDLAKQSKETLGDGALAKADALVQDARRKGPRSLALGLGAPPVGAPPAPPRTAPRPPGDDDE